MTSSPGAAATTASTLLPDNPTPTSPRADSGKTSSTARAGPFLINKIFRLAKKYSNKKSRRRVKLQHITPTPGTA